MANEKPGKKRYTLTPERRAAMEVEAKGYEYAARRLRGQLERLNPGVTAAVAVRAAPAGGSADALVRRKFSSGYSDLQVMALFALAKHHLFTLSDLAEELGVGASTAWHAAERLCEWELVRKDTLNKPYQVAYFILTDEGKLKVAWLLGKV
ncbi:MAG: helix-turn-helix domain-containing protein [Verrucomicrobiota bacterium]